RNCTSARLPTTLSKVKVSAHEGQRPGFRRPCRRRATCTRGRDAASNDKAPPERGESRHERKTEVQGMTQLNEIRAGHARGDIRGDVEQYRSFHDNAGGSVEARKGSYQDMVKGYYNLVTDIYEAGWG